MRCFEKQSMISEGFIFDLCRIIRYYGVYSNKSRGMKKRPAGMILFASQSFYRI
jgi:hypothetical protein